MEHKHDLSNTKDEHKQKPEQKELTERARQEQEWWRSVKYPDAPASSER